MFAASQSGSARSWSRLDGVDLLRGLAILLVLMNHVNMQLLFAKVPYTRGLPKQLVSSLVWNGQSGVQIFFVVSGFLITATTLRRWGSLGAVDLRQFCQLRFARIAPLLLLVLATLSVLDLAHVPHFVVSAKTGGLTRALLAALTFHVNLLEARRGYLPGNWDILWSLSVEEMFYLVFPLTCRLLGRGRLLISILLIFVLLGPFGRTVLSHGNPVWQEYSYLGGMDAIALGCLTAMFAARHTLSRSGLTIVAGAGASLLVFSLCFSIRAYAWGLGRSGLSMTILAIGTSLVILVAAQTRWRSPRILSPVRRLGERSYEVYLTHMFVVLTCFYLFSLAGQSVHAVPVLFLGVLVCAGVLGECVARVYSEPMNGRLRRFWSDGTRLGSAGEAAATQPGGEPQGLGSS